MERAPGRMAMAWSRAGKPQPPSPGALSILPQLACRNMRHDV
jgi:hypothetical protein